MPFPLTKLPREILIYHLLNFLGPRDIANVFSALNLEVTRELYDRVFQDNVNFDDYNVEMFRQRAGCSLYVLGDPEGRHYGVPDGPSTHYETVKGPNNLTYRRMHTACQVEPIAGDIVQISAGGTTFEILNCRGELFTTVSSAETDIVTKVKNVQGHTKVSQEGASRYFTPEASRFVQVASASPYILAMEESGLLWKRWWHTKTEWKEVPFILSIPGTILQLRLSVYYAACLVSGQGIVVFNEIEEPNGWRMGYPCRDGRPCRAKTINIPGTSHSIRDFAIADETLICLKNDGSVFAVTLDRVKEGAFDSNRDTYPLTELNNLGPFVQLNASRFQFALVCQNNCIVTGAVSSYDGLIVKTAMVDDLKVLGVASVAVGHNHFLALTKQGDVYSWGREYFFDGCLGLGKLKDSLKLDGVEKLEICLEAKSPKKVELPGKACGVYAGKSCSAVLI